VTIDEIKELIHTFEESSLNELTFSQEGSKLSLKRKDEPNPVYTQPIMVHPTAVPTTQAAPAMAGVAPGVAPAQQTGQGEGDETPTDIELITSPIVGTFYRSPAPDSPPFCEPGDTVEKGSTLCILEAMKVMNELEAEFQMEIVAFRVNNGEMVEYGTPLLEVRRV
jgi:acetyl-CoA carboxylase biotin carboxyl carrier protein